MTLAAPARATLPAAWDAARRWSGWASVASVVVLLALWELSSRLVASTYFPGPWAVAVRFVNLAQGRLPTDVVASLTEAIGGWLIGSALGIVGGLVIGRSPVLAEYAKPVLNFLRHISPLAWVPLAVLWLGIGYWSKTSVIVLIAFFNLLVNTAHGVTSIEEDMLKAARMLGLRRHQRLQVLLMSALPDILVGLRFALGTAWGGVVISELVAGNTGIGALELYGGQSFDVAQVMVGMAVIAVLGLLANALFLAVQRRLFPWLVSSRADAEAPARTTP